MRVRSSSRLVGGEEELMRARAMVIVAASLSCAVPLSAATAVRSTVPTRVARKQVFAGIASWYGKRHQGRRMANGERFDRRSLTAASRWLPLGTRIRVVNLDNHRFVDVTITDRGPAKRLHRVLDLSEAAARELGFIGQGEAHVFFFALPPSTAMDVVAEAQTATDP